MKRLLRTLFAWLDRARPWCGASPQTSPPATSSDLPVPAVYAPDWEPEHQLQLQQFLKSTTGRVLMQRARAIEFLKLQEAAVDVFHTAHSAARAAGFGDGLNWLLSLSRSSRATDDSGSEVEQTDTTPTGGLERVN